MVTFAGQAASAIAEPLAPLNNGDRIEKLAGNNSVILYDEITALALVLTAENTPYTVNTTSEQQALPVLVKNRSLASKSSTQSKHDIHQYCHLQGINLNGSNSLTELNENLWLSWQNGQGPFSLKLRDETWHVLVEREVNDHEASLTVKNLQWGQVYSMELGCYVQEKNQLEIGLESFALQFNKAPNWPKAVFAIKTAQLEEPVKMRLITAYLACIDEFRFQALQWAVRYGFTTLQQQILSQETCST